MRRVGRDALNAARRAVDKRPSPDHAPVTGPPVEVAGLHCKSGLDAKVQGGLVFKQERNGVPLAVSPQFHGIEYLRIYRTKRPELFNASLRLVTRAADQYASAKLRESEQKLLCQILPAIQAHNVQPCEPVE